MDPALTGVITAVVTGAFAWTVKRTTSWTEREGVGQAWYDRLDKRLAETEEKLDKLQSEVETLRIERVGLRSLIASLVGHVRAWRRTQPDPALWPSEPDEVTEAMSKF